MASSMLGSELRPIRSFRSASTGTETDGSDVDASLSQPSPQQDGISTRRAPALLHKVKNKRSILALVASEQRIFAGTQGGEILVWSLETYERLRSIPAHRGAVLGLSLSQDGGWLFSCAGDAIVNVWCTKSLSRLYSIYSTYDVGDVFCVAYSSLLQTVYLGAQNTSIQWYDLSRKDLAPPTDLHSHPAQRSHRFFDSKGPGGISTPRSADMLEYLDRGGEILEIDRSHIVQYAHYGYVYCIALCKGLNSDPEQETLVSGGGDGTVKLWALRKGPNASIEQIGALETGDSSILSMATNNTLLYTGRLEGEVNVWDLETRQSLRTFKAHSTDVLTLSIGNGLIFSGGADGRVKIFERYKCKNDWKAHERLILASTVINFKGQPYLITGGNDDCIAIWDLTETYTLPVKGPKPSNEQLVQSLSKFVSFKTVSAKAEYSEDCRQGASWLRMLFKRYGALTEVLRTDDSHNPVILARFKGRTSSGKKILFYGHYDVIPATNETSKWVTEPFTMEGRDGYLYGRGVTDNKGPILAALYAVADLIAEKKLETDVVFLIEGEEESGSRGFEATVKRSKELIGPIKWILLANSYWLNDDLPCLTYGLRGVIHASITVEGGTEDLHSGVNGSKLMDEPLKDLVTLMAKLNGPDNCISIPNFYHKIIPTTPAEEKRYKAIETMLKNGNSKHEDASSLKARWREPSLTIHNFKTSGAGNSTIIPHLASVSLSIRLVPDQSATEIQNALIAYLHQQFRLLKTANRLSISTGHPADPWLGDPDNEIYQMLEEAIVEVWKLESPTDTIEDEASPKSPTGPRKSTAGKPGVQPSRKKRRSTAADIPDSESLRTAQKPLYIREGGSIPVIRFLEKEFDAPAAQLPCGQSSDSAHLDNERIRLLNLYNSRKIFKKVFRDLPLMENP